MSQYPSPYTPPPVPPNYGYDFNYYQPQAPQDALAPARRASVIMFVMGGLLALGGLCCGAVGAMAPLDQIMSQNPALSSTPGVTPELMKISVIVMGVLALLFGMALLVLGYFVRGGGTGVVITSLVLVGIAVLFGALVVISGLFQLRGGGPQVLAGLCMYVLPLVLLIVLLVQLIQAVKMAPHVAMAKSQYQQQYWQYQQQQQMYQTGYGAPPPPSDPAGAQPPPAPPVDPDAQNPRD